MTNNPFEHSMELSSEEQKTHNPEVEKVLSDLENKNSDIAKALTIFLPEKLIKLEYELNQVGSSFDRFLRVTPDEISDTIALLEKFSNEEDPKKLRETAKLLSHILG